MTWDIESIIDEAEPAQTAVTICVKGSLKAEYERLETQFADVGNAVTNLAGGGPGSEIAARMVELREQMKTYERTFTLRAVIPRRAWRNLQAKRPIKTPEMDADAYGDVYHPWVCSVVAASVLSRSSGVKSKQPELSDNPDHGSLAGSPDAPPSTSTTSATD